MAVNEAAIRVTADTAPFQADMRKAEKKVKGTAKKMEETLGSSLKRGFGEGKTAAKNLLGSVRDITTQVLTLGGAAGAGALVVSAVQAEKANIALANILSAVQDKTVGVAEAQKLVADAALATGESMDVIRISAQNLTTAAKAGMDLEDVLVRSTKMAQRFNVEGGKMSEIWGRVIGGGFAGSVDEAEALIEQVGVTMLNTGVAMEDAFNPNDMMEFFAKMQQFGVPIQAGIVLLENMEGTVRDLGEALELPEELGEMLGSTKGLQAIRDASGMTTKNLSKNLSIAENLIAVLKKGPKAFKVLQAGLGEKATIGFERLLGVDIIEAAAKRKLKTGELQEAVDKVEDAFSRAAKVQFDSVQAAKRNAELADTSAHNFQNAITRMQEAFQKEKVTDAINKVAKALPGMAEAIGKFVAYAVDNPWTVITGVVSAKLGAAVAAPVIGHVITSGFKAMFARIAAVQLAGAAASSVAGGAMAGAGGLALGAAAIPLLPLILGVLAAVGGIAGLIYLINREGNKSPGSNQRGRGPNKVKITGEDRVYSGRRRPTQSVLTDDELMDGPTLSSFEPPPAPILQSVDTLESSVKLEAESARVVAALAKIGGAAEGAATKLDKMHPGSYAGGFSGGGNSTRGTQSLPQIDGNYTPGPG